MKKYIIIIGIAFMYSCSGFVKVEKYNNDMQQLESKVAEANKKEYQLSVKLDSLSTQVMILENQLLKLKKKIANQTAYEGSYEASSYSSHPKERANLKTNVASKLTQKDILKINELSKKEEEEPIVLTNSMLGHGYKEVKASKKTHKKHKEVKKSKKKKYSKRHLIRTMKMEYANALDFHRKSKFDESITAFKHLVKKYAHLNSSLTDNFYYWLGENYLSLRDIPLARKNFNYVIKHFSRSNKVPDSMFKLGFILEQEGQAEKAVKEYYQLLVNKYPNTEVGKLAKERITKLRP